MELKSRLALGVAAEPRLPEFTRPLPHITMGVKGLTKLLSDHAAGCVAENTLGTYFGRKIAIDASLSIYQFLIVVGRKGMTTLMNEAGGDTSHLQGMLTRTTRLLEAGIKPLYVFDGNPPELKKKELLKRSSRREAAVTDLNAALENGDNAEIEKYSKRMIRVTKQHSEDCRRLLQLIGVPAIQAPGEAEAECATLCKSGKVYAVSSEDTDSLTFGAPKFLRHLMDPTSRKSPVLEFDLQKVLHLLNLTMDEFIDLCILCGCDYCETIKGIGPQTALKLIHRHGRLEDVLENINKDRYKVPDSWPFQETRQLFKNPVVSTVEDLPEIHWAGPDEQGLRRFLVDENNFNYERVLKAIEKIKAVNIQDSKDENRSTMN